MSDTQKSLLSPAPETLEIKLEDIESTALARLVEEVRNDGKDELPSTTTYNRTYHRHNR